jgi:hypothetical protein
MQGGERIGRGAVGEAGHELIAGRGQMLVDEAP